MSTRPNHVAQQSTIAGLDVLRLVAACCVMFSHYAYGSWVDRVYDTGLRRAMSATVSYPELFHYSYWGGVGVEVFFVISGFVISISAQGRTAAQFVRGRVLRMVPALWLFATTAFLVTLMVSPLALGEIVLLYVKSLVLFPKGPWIDGVYWTLTVEVVFYSLIFALLFFQRGAWFATIAYGGAIFALAFWGASLLDHWDLLPASISTPLQFVREAYASRLLLITTGSHFALGMVLSLMYSRKNAGISAKQVSAAAAALIAGCTAIFLSVAGPKAGTVTAISPFVHCGAYLAAVTAIALSLWAAKSSRRQMPERARFFVRTLGLASYPIYLIHYVTGAWVFGIILRTGIDKFAALALALSACIVASWLFVLWLERPIKGWVAFVYDAAVAQAAIGARRFVNLAWGAR